MNRAPSPADVVRKNLREQGWVCDEEDCWRPAHEAPRCFRDSFVETSPGIVFRWFVDVEEELS